MKIRFLLLLCVFATSIAPPAAATPTQTAFVYVHGMIVNPTAGTCPSNDGSATWGDLINYWGPGQLKHEKWGFYECDVNQDVMIGQYGYYPNGDSRNHSHIQNEILVPGSSHHNMTKIRQNVSIEDLGYHFAWAVWRRYSSQGKYITAIGHSMGGLIIRHAMAKVAAGHSKYPPYLLVVSALTYGTPHAGAMLARHCVTVFGYAQCKEISTNSAFLQWLAANAQNPQGSGGTVWTVVGSSADSVACDHMANYIDTSCTSMNVRWKVGYFREQGIHHSDYLHRGINPPLPANTASANYAINGNWSSCRGSYPWPGPLIVNASAGIPLDDCFVKGPPVPLEMQGPDPSPQDDPGASFYTGNPGGDISA